MDGRRRSPSLRRRVSVWLFLGLCFLGLTAVWSASAHLAGKVDGLIALRARYEATGRDAPRLQRDLQERSREWARQGVSAQDLRGHAVALLRNQITKMITSAGGSVRSLETVSQTERQEGAGQALQVSAVLDHENLQQLLYALEHGPHPVPVEAWRLRRESGDGSGAWNQPTDQRVILDLLVPLPERLRASGRV